MHFRHGYPFYCLQINHGTSLTELAKATGEGERYGYTIYAYVHSSKPFMYGITDNSAKIVHENIYQDIHPGQLMEIALSKTNQTALAQPYSNCNETKDYRQVNCRDDCFNEKMTEICGCPFPKECGLFSERTNECIKADSKAVSIRSQCSLTCPAECIQVNFAINTVYVKWELEEEYFDYYKSKASKKFNIKGMTDDGLRKGFSKIHIYFTRLETTMITQSPSMTLTNLIANMGGLLGNLFI